MKIERKIVNDHALMQRIISVILAIVVAGLVIAICGYNPFIIYREMVVGSFGGAYYLQQTIQGAVPLLIMGLGVAICFRMRFINIGVEGQFCMGAVFATYVALNSNMAAPINWVLMFVAAFIGGGLWCLIAAFLKSKWGVSETLVTLMLNYVALKLVSYLQNVLWKDPKAYGFPKIANYPTSLQLPTVFGVNAGWIIALVLVVVVWVVLNRMKLGYEISVLGENPTTARYAGMSTSKILIISAIIGGGICGLAGLVQASGVEHTLNDSMSRGMGYTAIAISYMAKMKPVSILIVAFLFSILFQGGAYMQISMQIPSAISDVVQGIILLFVLAGEFFANYRFVRIKAKEA